MPFEDGWYLCGDLLAFVLREIHEECDILVSDWFGTLHAESYLLI